MIKIQIEKLPLPRNAEDAKLQCVGLTEQRWSLTAVGPDKQVYRTIYTQEQSVASAFNLLSPLEIAFAMERDLSLRRRSAILAMVEALVSKYPSQL